MPFLLFFIQLINLVPTNLSGSFWENRAFNDPCVIKVQDRYYMYLSRNTEDLYPDGRGEPVSTFLATSRDRVHWSLNNQEIIGLGSKNEWDYNKVETPSVVFFKGNYHLYYSGGSELSKPIGYKIGHGLSSDGVTWKKDPLNPLLTRDSIPDQKGILHVAEPGAVVFKDKIYLYFVVTSAVPPPSPTSAKMEIFFAVSDDGFHFTPPQKILFPAKNSSAENSLLGYSTPAPVVCQNKLELYYDVFYQTNNSISPYEQVQLKRAVSGDGIHFIEDSEPLLKNNCSDWTAREIRGGNVIIENGRHHMWFSGDNYTFNGKEWNGKMTIGYTFWEEVK